MEEYFKLFIDEKIMIILIICNIKKINGFYKQQNKT